LHDNLKAAEDAINWYRNIFGDDFYLEVDLHPNTIEKRIYPKQKYAAKWLFILGNKLGVKVVAANDVHYLDQSDAIYHDRMLREKTHSDINDPNRFRYTGEEWFKSQEEMEHIFTFHPDAVYNTMEILSKITEDYRNLEL